jgi:hypothetical protein
MKIIITENKRDRLVLKWLNNEFDNLTRVVQDRKVFYVQNNGLPLFFYYQISDKYVIINPDRIWKLLESIFGMSDDEIARILHIWLKESYDLNLTPVEPLFVGYHHWDEPII